MIVKIIYGNVVWDFYVKENFFVVYICLLEKILFVLVELISCIFLLVILVNWRF